MKKISLSISLLIVVSLFLSPVASTGETDQIFTQIPEIDTTGPDVYVIPTVIIADYYFFEDHLSDSINRINVFMETVNQLYYETFNLTFDVVLYEVHTTLSESTSKFTYTDVGGGEVSAGDLLSSLNTYANSNATINSEVEVVLLSGADFEGGNIGLAYVGDPNSPGNAYRGIVQATTTMFSDLFIAVTIAHEIGHNFGAIHDGVAPNDCLATGFIMSASSNPSSPETDFSDCSIDEISTLVINQFPSYIDNSNPVISGLGTSLNITQSVNDFYTIEWNVTDNNLKGYDLYLDGILVDSGTLSGTDISLSYDFSRDIAGNFTIDLNVTDAGFHSTLYSMNITVAGNLFPVFTAEPDGIEVNESESFILSWELEDDGSSTYKLYIDSNLMETGPVSPGGLTFEITITEFGVYNFTLIVTDDFDQVVISSVLVEVLEVVEPPVDTPPESSPDDPEPEESSTPADDDLGIDLSSLPFTSIYVFILSLLAIPVIRSSRRQ